MKQSTRVMLNSLFSLARQGTDMALRIFLLAFILRRVNTEEYGVFLVTIGLQRLMVLLRDSINRGCLTQVAGHLEQGNFDRINQTISSAVAFLAVPAVLAMIAAIFAGGPMGRFFDLGPELHRKMALILLLVGVDVLVVMPLSSYTAVVAAHQRYDIISIVAVCFRIFRAGLIVGLFLALGANVVFVMVATLVSDIGMRLTTAFFAHRLTPSLRVRPSLANRETLWALLRFGSFLILGALIAIGTLEATKWLIGRQLTIEYVTFLTVAMYMTSMLQPLMQTMTLVLVPVASRFSARADDGGLGEMLVRGTRYAVVISAGVAAIVLPVVGPLLGLWLRPGFSWIAPFAVVVGCCGAIALPADCARSVLEGTGDSRRPFQAILAGSAVTIVTVAASLWMLGWGLAGVVTGVGGGMLVMWAMMTFFALRAISVSRRRLVVEGYLQPIFAAVPAAGVGALMNYYLHPQSWLLALMTCAASAGTFLVAFIPHVTATEWATVRSGLRRIGRALRPGADS